MIGLAAAGIFIGFVILASFAAFELGYAQAEATYQPILERKQETIDALLPSGITILDIEPGSAEALFNAAYAHCEGCGGRGRDATGRPCVCTTWSTT